MEEKKRFFGFPATNIAGVLRLVNLGFDVELRASNFVKHGENLLLFENDNFYPNRKVIDKILDIVSLSNIQISLHDYMEAYESVPPEGDLYVANPRHHEPLLKRAIALEDVCGILKGRIITRHIALFKGGNESFSEDEAKTNAGIFYKEYDQIRMQDKRVGRPLIGLENNPREAEFVDIGSSLDSFEYIFGKIKTFCTTLDVGHLQLTPNMSQVDLSEFNIQHVHFHGNDGKKDLHRLATLDNLINFYEYCDFLKNNNHISVLVEVSIKHYTDDDLVEYADKLKKLIKWR